MIPTKLCRDSIGQCLTPLRLSLEEARVHAFTVFNVCNIEKLRGPGDKASHILPSHLYKFCPLALAKHTYTKLCNLNLLDTD